MWVIVVGLDMDFKGNFFGLMFVFMVIVEYVIKVYVVCMRIGNFVYFSYWKV